MEIHASTTALKCALGRNLRQVGYWVLPLDASQFDAGAPNSTGLAAILIEFEGCSLNLRPDWERTSRAPEEAYYLSIRNVARDCEDLIPVDATDSPLWSSINGRVLEAARLYARFESPQVVELQFGGETLAICTGYPDAQIPTVGDGDEVLVFQGGGWRNYPATCGNNWHRIWQSDPLP